LSPEDSEREITNFVRKIFLKKNCHNKNFRRFKEPSYKMKAKRGRDSEEFEIFAKGFYVF